MTQHNRRFALERVVVGVPLVIYSTVLVLLVAVLAFIYATADIALSFIFGTESMGDRFGFHRVFDMLENNGHMLLYGEEERGWQVVP